MVSARKLGFRATQKREQERQIIIAVFCLACHSHVLVLDIFSAHALSDMPS